MGSMIFAVGLPLARALVMFGLGLTLTVDDFAGSCDVLRLG